MIDNPYKVLQVDPDAHPDVIEAAYRALTHVYHPSRNAAPEAAEMLGRVEAAYRVLIDQERRREHDRRFSRQGLMKLVFGSGSSRAVLMRLATTALPLVVVGAAYVFLLDGLGGTDALVPDLSTVPSFEDRLAMLTPTARPTSSPAKPETLEATAIDGAERDRLLGQLAEYGAAIESDPTDVEAFLRRGVAHVGLAQHELAIVDFDEAIRLDPGRPGAYFERAVAHGHAGNFQRSVEDYTRAVELDVGYALAYANRALAYVLLGMDPEAQRDVDKAVELGVDAAQLSESVRALREQR